MFLVLEGPNGVGKSTVLEALLNVLRDEGPDVTLHPTTEPTRSRLGRAIREMESELQGVALALACAADRFDHVRREIEPALARGDWVICDRYVPSSLVLQRIDGLDVKTIWAMNAGARPPDVTFYLDDAPSTIQHRLSDRPSRSRLEGLGGAETEATLYQEARVFLEGQGWRQAVIDCRGKAPHTIAGDIAERLL